MASVALESSECIKLSSPTKQDYHGRVILYWKTILLLSFLSLLYVDTLRWAFWLCLSTAFVLGLVIYQFVSLSTDKSFTRKICVGVTIFCLGLTYSQWRAERSLDSMLLEENHGAVVKVTAVVASPVRVSQSIRDFSNNNRVGTQEVLVGQEKLRFIANILSVDKVVEASCRFEKCDRNLEQIKKIQLNYYRPLKLQINSGVSPRYGDKFSATVKLRTIDGTSVPGGFDIRRHALSQGIDTFATMVEVHSVHAGDQPGFSRFFVKYRRFVMTAINQSLAELEYGGVFRALLFGEKQGISDERRELFQNTGTQHLLAVSGLHIGICILVFGGAASVFSNILPPSVLLNRRMVFAVAGLSGGFFYLTLAGFPVSGNRAFLMAAFAMLSMLFGSETNRWNHLLLAALIICMINPLAILSAGFWLSFVAVAFLMWAFAQYTLHKDAQHRLDALSNKSWLLRFAYRCRAYLLALLVTQLVLMAGMPIIYVALGIDTSLLVLLANLVVVPVFSLLVIPLCFLGLVSGGVVGILDANGITVLGHVSNVPFKFADMLTNYLVIYLSEIERLNSSMDLNLGLTLWPFPVFIIGIVFILIVLRGKSTPGFGLAVIACVLVLSPRITPAGKALDRLSFNLSPNDLAITQIDVGQGSAYLLSMSGQHWLYDTGPSFLFGGDAGEFSILPLLGHYQISRLDGLIVSHADNDHKGGLVSVLKNITVDKLYVPSGVGDIVRQQFAGRQAPAAGSCETLREGVLLDDAYVLTALWPAPFYNPEVTSSNDSSCVVQLCSIEHKHEGHQATVTKQACRVLLAGDVSTQSERHLAELFRDALASDILSVAHHGSLSSSSHLFLDAVGPRWGLISSGRWNRYGHPHKTVLRRLAQRDILALASSKLGTVQLIYRAKNKQWEGPFCSRYHLTHFWQLSSATAQSSCTDSLI